MYHLSGVQSETCIDEALLAYSGLLQAQTHGSGDLKEDVTPSVVVQSMMSGLMPALSDEQVGDEPWPQRC